MLLAGEDVPQTNPHHRATAQFCLSDVDAARGIDPRDDLGIDVRLSDGRDIALRCPRTIRAGLTFRRSVPTHKPKANHRHHDWRRKLESLVVFDPLGEKFCQTKMLSDC